MEWRKICSCSLATCEKMEQLVTMPYAVYKRQYSRYKTVYGSYNGRDKTIIVNLPDNVEYAPPEQSENAWIKIPIAQGNVKCVGAKSTLIKLPYHSDYRNYEVWVSSKLIRKKGNYELIVKPDFDFVARKGDEEIEINGEDLARIFNVSNPEQEESKIHIPEILEPTKCEALEELIDE